MKAVSKHLSMKSIGLLFVMAVTATLLPMRAASAQDRPFLRPRKEGRFATKSEAAARATSRSIGELGGYALTEIDIPGKTGDMGRTLQVDSQGYIWFLIRTEDKVGKLDPKTLDVVEYNLPRAAAPFSFAIDSKDVIWMASQEGMDMLLEFHPADDAVISHNPPDRSLLVFVKTDPRNGTVYFNQPGANSIGAYLPSGQFREYKLPTKGAVPASLDIDSAGNVWFPEILADKVAKLNPQTGQIQEWDLPTKQGYPAVLTVGKSGTVWISLPQADKIVAFNNGSFKEYPIPTPDSVVSTTVEDDQGIVWFTEGGWGGTAGGNKFGRLDPKTGKVDELALTTTNAQPLGLVMDKNGTMWFEEKNAAKVVRVAKQKMVGQMLDKNPLPNQ
jgi:streptogramin lyase